MNKKLNGMCKKNLNGKGRVKTKSLEVSQNIVSAKLFVSGYVSVENCIVTSELMTNLVKLTTDV